MTRDEWIAMANEMDAAADTLEKVSAIRYGEQQPDRDTWTAQELRREAVYVRKGERPAEKKTHNEKGISE